MNKDSFDPSQDRFIRGIIKRKVGQLIGRAGFTSEDRGPLEHDLFAQVLGSLPKYDPQVGHRNKYVTAVVERCVVNILRDKKAEKRNGCRITSLNVMIDVLDEGPTELSQLIGDDEQGAKLGRYSRSEQELFELASDVRSVIEKLPADWKRLLELRDCMPMTAIASLMKVPRTTLNVWMKRIRERFEEAGLLEYLKD